MKKTATAIQLLTTKFKLGFGLLVLLLTVLFVYVIVVSPQLQTQLCSWQLSTSVSETTLKSWQSCIANLNLSPSLQQNSDLIGFITAYAELANGGGLIPYAQVSLTADSTHADTLKAGVLPQVDPSFLAGQSYIAVPGRDGGDNYHTIVLDINGQLSAPLNVMHQFDPEVTDQIKATGEKSLADVVSASTRNFGDLKQAIDASDVIRFGELVKDGSTGLLEQIKSLSNWQYKTDNAKLGDFTQQVVDDPAGRYVQVGKFKVTQAGCSADLQLVYDKQAQQYQFDGLVMLFQHLCDPVTASVISTLEINLNCSNCWLAAVDKVYKLPSSYAPAVMATGLAGGGQLVSEAVAAMQKMFNDAAAKGVNIKIVSSYRSYQTQVTTFEYWVQTEIAKGYSRAQAVVRANVYSAMPGHSEHQLGTTADLSCTNCAAFDFSSGNNAVYNYLALNAYKFGFVVSYPQGTQALTGYTYEPWHVRYIGTDLATELFNTGYLNNNGNFLAKFLRDKFGV